MSASHLNCLPLDLAPLSFVAALFFVFIYRWHVGSRCRCLLFAFLGITPLFLRLESEHWVCRIHFPIALSAHLAALLRVATRGDSRRCVRVHRFSLSLSISSIALIDWWCMHTYSRRIPFRFCWLVSSPFCVLCLIDDVCVWMIQFRTLCSLLGFSLIFEP
jgi:hypothetical protein